MARVDLERRSPPRGALPSIAQIAARERGRGKTSYQDWFVPGGTLEGAIASMAETLDGTPGLWLDTATLTPEETVAEILRDNMAASRYDSR